METFTPHPGDIGLVQMPGLVGRLIRLGQWLNGDGWSDVQHAFMVISEPGPTGGEYRIIEAMPGGAIESPLSRYENYPLFWIACPDEYRDGVADCAWQLLGTPYSFLDYVALAVQRAHLWPLSTLLGNYVASSKHAICSQLCDLAAQCGGWHLFEDGRPSGQVTPNDLLRLVR